MQFIHFAPSHAALRSFLLIFEAHGAQIRRMVVTMGAQGAVFATLDGEEGYCPAKKVDVKDTTGAGDAFFAGTVIGQTYGKTMMESLRDRHAPCRLRHYNR